MPPPSLHTLPAQHDTRGSLVYANPIDAALPFMPQHYFVLHNLRAGVARGAHAHRAISQVLHCVAGACTVRAIAADGTTHEFQLDSPAHVLHSPPMTWIDILPTHDHTVITVLSDQPYNADDYIRDRSEFLRRISAQGTT